MLGDGDRAHELFDMLNPIRHTASPRDIAVYLAEPYVMAADVYMSNPYRGRAGWTWYTGAAGWMYQAGVEWILGIRREGGRLRLEPRIPAGWPGFRAEYRFGGSVYAIEVRNRRAGGGGGVEPGLTIDGKPLPAWSGQAGEAVPALSASKQAAAEGAPASNAPKQSAAERAPAPDAPKQAAADGAPPTPTASAGGWFIDLVDDGARHEVVLQL
jgi:hypothetical protein